MLTLTKKSINTNKRQLTALALNFFQANYINVLNGHHHDDLKNDALTRELCGFAHLRFTKTLDFSGAAGKTGFAVRQPKDYKYTYIYYTTSTRTDKKSCFKQKIEKNLSDLCFNVRKEVLDNPFGSKDDSFYFVVDTGYYFFLITKKQAQENVISTQKFQGRDVCTVRCTQCSVKKTTVLNNENFAEPEIYKKLTSWDAKYIQNACYTHYKASNAGLIKVENYLNGKLVALNYFVSAQQCADFFKMHGLEHRNNYYSALARNKSSIKSKDGSKEFRFSRVAEVIDRPVEDEFQAEVRDEVTENDPPTTSPTPEPEQTPEQKITKVVEDYDDDDFGDPFLKARLSQAN